MSNPLVLLYAALVALALGGCQTLATRPAPQAKAHKPLPYKTTITPPREVDADLMFDYLAGQIGAQRGDTGSAYEHLIQAASRAKDPVVAAQAARMAIKLEDMNKAAEATKLWIEYDPNSLPARELATILALRRKDMDTALAQAGAVLKISEATAKDGFLQLATVLSGEKLDNKIELMEHLTHQHARDARAFYGLALVASQRKRFQLAHQALDQAIRLKPDWDKPWLLRAQLYTLQKNREAADKTLTEATGKLPSPLLFQARGRLLMQQKRYGEALEAFRQAARLAPEDMDVLSTIGVLAIQMKQWDLARQTWLKLASEGNFHKQQEAWYFLGQLEELQEHLQKAIEYYRKVKGGRFHQEARQRLAILIGKEGRLDEAGKLFREIRLTNPTQAIPTFITEAQLYKEEGHPEKAMAIYNEAITANPESSDLLYARGLLAADLGKVEQAERDLRAVLDLAPDDTDALNALGYTLADQTDRLEEAYAYISRAYSQAPDSAAILDSMGWVLYRLGKPEEALTYLRKAAKKLQDGEIAAHLGEVLWALGRREEARKVWREAQKFAPDNPTLKQTIERFR
jgi:tetratricopeptide (TPR) repeat protein